MTVTGILAGAAATAKGRRGKGNGRREKGNGRREERETATAKGNLSLLTPHLSLLVFPIDPRRRRRGAKGYDLGTIYLPNHATTINPLRLQSA